MNIKTIELTNIKPSEGMILTNGETYSKDIYLGTKDSIDNWHEITEEEYQEIQKSIEEETNV